MFTLTKINVLWDKVKALNKRVDGIQALPDPSGASDGQLLAVNDGEWVIGNAPEELPDPSGATDGQALIIDDGAWIIGDVSGGGGVNYSTTEQDTGLTWIDGRPIYQRTYTGVLARGEYDYWNKMDLGATDAVAIIDLEGSLYDAQGNLIPYGGSLTSSNSGYGDYSWPPRIAGGHLEIGFNNSTLAVGFNYILTIKYVKAPVTNTRAKKSKK